MARRDLLTDDQRLEADAIFRALEDADDVHGRWSVSEIDALVRTGRVERVDQGRQIVPVVLSNVEPSPTRWAWEGRIPIGSVTILAGRQGLGKSTLLAKLAADLSRGDLPGDLHGQKSTVLLATFEDDLASTATPRQIAAGADTNCVVGLELHEDGKPDLLSLPGDLALIAATAKQYRASVLMVDPLMAALPGAIDSHRDQDVRRALAPLGQLAAEAELAVLCVLHLRKGAATEALDRVSGSVAFTAAARSVLAFGKAEDDEDGTGRVLAHAKSNLGPLAPSLAFHIESATVDHKGLQIPTSRLVFDGETDLEAGELLSPAPEDRTEVDIAADWLADNIGDGEWHPTADVRESAKAADIASRTLQRAASRLGVESERHGFPSRGHWRLALVAPLPTAPLSRQVGWRGSVSGSTEPNSPPSESQSRLEPLPGATDAQEAEAERLAAKFGVAA